jgi:hypothetical protein
VADQLYKQVNNNNREPKKINIFRINLSTSQIILFVDYFLKFGVLGFWGFGVLVRCFPWRIIINEKFVRPK